MKRAFSTAVCLAAIAGSMLVAQAEDNNVTVVLSHHNLTPERIEVHVGDIVTWRSAAGERIELRFDLHPRAHDVVSPSSAVRAFLRQPGEHVYSGRIKDGRRFRGVVFVRDGDRPAPASPQAECDASGTLCIVP